MMSPLVSALACVAALAIGQTNLQPEAARIAEAAAQLGSPDFAVRQKATEDLWRAGPAAEGELRAALKSADPEVRTRAAAVLNRLRLGIRPETPGDVLVLIDQFLYGGSAQARQQAFAELQAKADLRLILNLIRGEANEPERQALAALVAAQTGTLLRPLLEQDRLDEVQELLELVATSDQGLAQLAAFLLLTGRIDQQIEVTRERLASDPRSEDTRRLVQLLRAKGDYAAAAEALDPLQGAERSGGPSLQRAKLLAAAHRWEEAAKAAADLAAQDASQVEAAALAATFHRLAGNRAGYEEQIAALSKRANVDGAKAAPAAEPDPFAPTSNQPSLVPWMLAETLLVNDEPDRAAGVLQKTNPALAHVILWRQQKHAEALALCNVAPGKALDQDWLKNLPAGQGQGGLAVLKLTAQFQLAVQLARQLRELGRSEQVDEILKTLRTAAATDNDQGSRWAIVVQADWQLGRYDDLGRDGVRALAAGTPPLSLFSRLVRQQGSLAAFWHAFINDRDPQADRAKAFEQCLWMVVPQLPPGRLPGDWRKLVDEAYARATMPSAQSKKMRMLLLAETCLVRGDRDLARKYFGEVAESDLAAAIKMGDLEAAEGDWSIAATWYEKAASQSVSDPLGLYLHGHALAQSGQAEAGAARMRLASLLALPMEARQALAAGLQERGLKAEAAEQFDILRRTAPEGSNALVSATQQLGNLVSAGEPFRAADCWQQLLLFVQSPITNFTEGEGYLSLPQLIHKVRARAFLKEGKWEGANEELDKAGRTLKGDVRLLVEFVPKLDRAGQISAANKLFDEGFAAHQEVCAAFPNSATYHNNAAWLAARSQRKLDEALALVTRAIELAPNEAAYHDTLAEVQFQRGDREAAVAAARKAVELSGDSKLAAARLKHFENDELQTLDGTEAEGN
jgi:hypothetical protein